MDIKQGNDCSEVKIFEHVINGSEFVVRTKQLLRYSYQSDNSEICGKYYEIQSEILTYRQWQTGQMTPVRSFVSSRHPNARLSSCRGTRQVGLLRGYLLPRPCPFFSLHAEVDTELEQLCSLFCDSSGVGGEHHNCIEHEALGDKALNGGGLLHIKSVEIHPEFTGRDLGLKLVHTVLTCLKKKWTLCLMVALPLASGEWRSYEEEKQFRENCKSTSADNANIQRHFSRIGFIQAGHNSQHASIWFLTSKLFFDRSGRAREIQTKEESKSLDIYLQKEHHNPEGVHRELHDLIHHYGSQYCPIVLTQERLEEMSCLVQRGASIHQARALHVAASYGSDYNFLLALVKLGGDVNATDEYGRCPLHFSVRKWHNSSTSRALLSLGADPNIKDEMDKTPLDNAWDRLIECDGIGEGCDRIDSPPNVELTVLKCRTFAAFLQPQECDMLRNGWMSPRLEAVLATVGQTILAVIDNCLKWNFGERTTLNVTSCPEIECLLEYIPPHIAQNFLSNIPKSFVQGFGIVVSEILYVLNKLKAIPTTRAVQHVIQEKLHQEEYAALHGYFQLGGIVEYALDALITLSKNVFLLGSDACGLEFDDILHGFHDKPLLPLDGMFDVAWIECISFGGGQISARGPYPIDTTIYY